MKDWMSFLIGSLVNCWISSTFGNEVLSLVHWHLLWAHNRFFFSIVYRRYISSCSVDKLDQCYTGNKPYQWFLKQLDPRADWVNFLRLVGQKVQFSKHWITLMLHYFLTRQSSKRAHTTQLKSAIAHKRNRWCVEVLVTCGWFTLLQGLQCWLS